MKSTIHKQLKKSIDQVSKNIVITLIINLICLCGFAQSPDLPREKCTIVKRNDKLIKGVRLWSISKGKLEYELEGSLHDLLIDDITIIKTNDEIISFDAEYKMRVRPYDLIFTYRDTIRCRILKISGSTIYYIRRERYRKQDYTALSSVQEILQISDTTVFDSILDEYYEVIRDNEQMVVNKDPETERGTPTNAAVEDSYVEESEQKDSSHPSAGSGSGSGQREAGPTRKFYADKHGNNDLILTKRNLAIICRIDKVTTNRIYYHILRKGPDPRGHVEKDDVLKYVNTTTGHNYNTDVIILNSGKSITCKIQEIKKGRVHFLIYRRGPETRSSYDLNHVKSYHREPIAEFSEAELYSVQKSGGARKPEPPGKNQINRILLNR
ncbi:MAG TPA: hypothetical protein EYN69_05150 [Flavobacteriales bacterium]|nr:hypothetical protein [Flavobacteriales bacterium]